MRTLGLFVALSFVTASVLRAACPTPQWPWAWSNGFGVGYNTPTRGPGPAALTNLSIASLGILGSIQSAFSTWHYANQSQNSSNIGFYYNNGNGPFRIYAVQVNYPGVPFMGDPGKAAIVTLAMPADSTTLSLVSLVFYHQSKGIGGYTLLDQGASNYQTFIEKVTLHEIGHTMGLADQPISITNTICLGQTAGESVMNGQCGTNDADNNMPTSVMYCDNQAVQ